jgi:hypothetical protein
VSSHQSTEEGYEYLSPVAYRGSANLLARFGSFASNVLGFCHTTTRHLGSNIFTHLSPEGIPLLMIAIKPQLDTRYRRVEIWISTRPGTRGESQPVSSSSDNAGGESII